MRRLWMTLSLFVWVQEPVSFLAAGSLTSIPFERHAGFLWVEVGVENSVSPLRFLVDTGAEVTVVETRAADRLGLRHGPRVLVRGVGGTTTGSWCSEFRGELGGVRLPRRTLILDLDRFQKAVGAPVDGLVGADFFRRRVVQFDFKENRLRLLKSVSGLARDEAIRLRLGAHGFLLPAAVDEGPAAWVRLDTGCAAALHWVTGEGVPSQVDRAPVIGVAAVGVRTIRGTLRIGGRTWERVPMECHAAPMFPDESGLLGNGFLTTFRAVTLDGRRGRLWMESR